MNLKDIINELIKLNIRVEVQKGELTIHGSKENITPGIIAKIKEHKSELIKYLESAGSKKYLISNIPFAKAGLGYPLSSSQQRLWVLSQFEESSVTYNLCGTYVFEGDLNIEALENSFNTLIERHESLRTVFKEDEQGELKQFIHSAENVKFKIAYQNLRNEEGQEEKLKKLIQLSSLKPFDLAAGPLLRANLYQVENNKWVFNYVMHHIISDGWSMMILIEELLQLYNGYIKGETNPLSPLRIQYKDYAAWQQEQLSGEILQAHKSYWLKQFEGELPVLNFPADRARPAMQTHNGGRVSKRITSDITRELKRITKEQGSTLFMGLLATVNTLLYRYTEQEDIIIGSPIAGREHADLEGQIGFYLNTLALRTKFKGKDSYKDILANIREVTLGAYEHQVYPFDELVGTLPLKQDMSRNTLFDVSIVLQNTELNNRKEYAFGELKVSEYGEKENFSSKFDWSFNFVEIEEEIQLVLIYNSDVYNKDTAQRFIDHFEQLLEAVLTSPDKSINKLDFLSSSEKRRLVEEFNTTETAYPKDKTLVDLFEEQAFQTPGDVAVVFEETELTYKELNEKSNQLANYLLKISKIKPDDRIGIQLQRSEWMIIAILGVLKSGAAYVPIDPDYPKERIDYMLKDSQCKTLVDKKELEKFQKVQKKYSTENLKSISNPKNLAYIIYTSGSTGQPKGVMIEHKSVVNYLFGIQTKHSIFSDFLFISNICFDASIKQMFLPIITGKKIYVFDIVNNLDVLASYISKHKIEVLNATPGVISGLIDLNMNSELLQSVKSIIIGGEVFDKTLLAKIKSKIPQALLINAYGPTETCANSTTHEFYSIDTAKNIGSPLANTQIYILDAQKNITPVGVTGEICVSGEGLARGYFNRPELTTEKFIPNPFNPAERIYKTGDLGRWLSNGTIEFIGRKDEQVKIRGYRIELGEIENSLLAHKNIDSAIVMAKSGLDDQKELVAYIVSKETLTSSDLNSYLSKLLPAYMIPSYYIQLDKLPLTPNGKINRKGLPDPDGLGISTGVMYVEPRNEIEEKLVSIWQKILGKEKIGVKDNFFELGGHSLKATRLTSQIQKEFEVKVTLRDVFGKVVLEEQAQLIQQAQKTAFVTIHSVPVQLNYLLSSSQRRIWVLSQFEESSIAYNMPGVYVFEGELNRDALESSFNTLIERHESLRTIFKEDEQGELKQFIHSVADVIFKIAYQDLRNEEEQEIKLKSLVQSASLKPFDLTAGPLLRANLYQVENNKWIFNYVMHHIISDGWSMMILIEELLQLYNACIKGETNPLSPLRIQYKDYAAWQQAQLSEEALQVHKSYWLKQFEGELSVLNFPGDKSRPAVQTYNGGVIRKTINENVSNKIKLLSQQQGCTLFMSLLAVVHTLLYRYTNQEDIIIGSPIAGREHPDLEDQIGLYINTLALRTRFKGANNYIELLENVKQVTLGAYEHQIFPFDELVGALQLQRNASRNALFDVMVALQNNDISNGEEQANLEGLKVSRYEDARNQISKLDLSFDFAEIGDEIHSVIEYNSDIYHKNTIGQLADHLEQLLDAIVEQPLTPICQLDFLSPKEKQKLIQELNDTEAEYPKDKTIVNLFEEQAVQTPNNIAVVFEGTELTYKELNEKSNQLAGYLRKTYGIKQDDLVGIKLERSEWVIIAMLGVLKSGGAYVPIDTEYPMERIEYMIQDGNCKVVMDEKELEAFKNVELQYAKKNLKPISKPGDLAYVIYTSGSTGQPKGVMIEHHSLLEYAFSFSEKFNIQDTDRIIHQSSISFDVHVEEIFPTLISGGALLISTNRGHDIDGLKELIQKKNATVLSTTPPVLSELNFLNIDLNNLRLMISGGDKFNASCVSNYIGKVAIHDGYGPSESTVSSTFLKIEDINTVSIIGQPISNRSIFILNDKYGIQPVGVIGEIYIGGSGLARGYLNKPELTAEKFITSPFEKGKRIYKTGDLGKWLHDGNIEFIGRKDEQVKIRGYRIELGEIENALQSYREIESAIVEAKTGVNGQKELVAYLIAKEKLTISDIRNYLSKSLPGYMIPSHFVQLDVFPLTPNGKVDRKKLPDPQGLSMETGLNYTAPGNEIEQNLAEVYEEVLKKKNIGVQEDFFALGGDSIKSIQVVSRLRQRGYHLTIQDVLLNPVIAELASRVKKVTRSISQQEVIGKIPLSPIQRIFLEDTSPDKHHYNQSVLLYSKKPLSEEGVKAALKRIVEHHDALRIVYRQTQNGWEQENKGKEQSFSLQVFDYINETTFAEACQKIQASMDLEKGPLLKAALFRSNNGDRLLLAVHHLVIDAVSWRILFEDLSNLYQQCESGGTQTLTLPLKTDSFKYWQEKQLEYSLSKELQKEDTYWSSIEALTIAPLPLDYPGGSNESKDTTTQTFTLDKNATQKLLTQCYKAYRTEINDILLASLGLALSNVFGLDKFLLQLEGHGREHIGAEVDVSRTIGWFTTVYPVVLDMSYSSDSIRQLIEIKESLHRIPNKGIGYGALRYLAGKEYTSSPQITFNYLGDFGTDIKTEQDQQVFEFSGEYHGREVSANRQRSSVLDVSGMIVEGKLSLSISYSSKQYTDKMIRRLLASYQEQLLSLIEKLSAEENEKLTPVDFTYKGLSLEELQELKEELQD